MQYYCKPLTLPLQTSIVLMADQMIKGIDLFISIVKDSGIDSDNRHCRCDSNPQHRAKTPITDGRLASYVPLLMDVQFGASLGGCATSVAGAGTGLESYTSTSFAVAASSPSLSIDI